MDLKAYANTYNEKLSNYIEKNYGEIPRCRGYELMRLVEKCGCDSYDNDEQTSLYNSFVGQDVIYFHTRCGDCGRGYDDEYSNYIDCGAKEWEEKYKDLFITHCTDEFDSTYCDHYFKAIINDEYNDLIKEGKKMEPHRRRQLIKIKSSFLERYKLAKQFGDKYYTEYFKRQIKDIDKELKGE